MYVYYTVQILQFWSQEILQILNLWAHTLKEVNFCETLFCELEIIAVFAGN